MKLNSIKKPQAKPTVNALTPEIGVVTPLSELTQLTSNTGAVSSFEVTANVAPVSLTLLVKTIIAPERIEYFARGKTIVLKTVKGLAPKVLAASSISTFIRSIAADIDRTKYGYVIAKCAKTNRRKSGIPEIPCQKNFNEMPKAIDGTIIGTLINESSIVEGNLPNVLRAISIAIGIPMITPKNVTVAPKPYDRSKLCQ
jgi:hypothetical protein